MKNYPAEPLRFLRKDSGVLARILYTIKSYPNWVLVLRVEPAGLSAFASRTSLRLLDVLESNPNRLRRLGTCKHLHGDRHW